MPAQVYYHKSFFKSRSKCEHFKDYLALEPAELNLLVDFVSDVKHGVALDGRNKPSWLDKNQKEILSVKFRYYKTCKLWHYHLGPFSTTPPKVKTKIRVMNIDGKTSSAIIHYKWYNEDMKELIIIAFSPIHDPFPEPDYINNPLKSRSGLLKKDQIEKA